MLLRFEPRLEDEFVGSLSLLLLPLPRLDEFLLLICLVSDEFNLFIDAGEAPPRSILCFSLPFPPPPPVLPPLLLRKSSCFSKSICSSVRNQPFVKKTKKSFHINAIPARPPFSKNFLAARRKKGKIYTTYHALQDARHSLDRPCES